MGTINGAIALNAEDEIGALAVGLRGDIAVFDRREQDPYQAIFDAEAVDTVLVLRDGTLATEGSDFAVSAEVCPVGCIIRKRVGFSTPIGAREFDKGLIGHEIEDQSDE